MKRSEMNIIYTMAAFVVMFLFFAEQGGFIA